MSNMWSGGIFGQNSQTSMDQMKQLLDMQLLQYNKMLQAQQAQQGALGLLEDFKSTVAQLSPEELQYLQKSTEFLSAKTIYEQGFIDFLGGKFASEYIATPVGKQAIENLSETAKLAVKQIKESAKERALKLEAMAALFESDPDILKKLLEKLNNK